MMLKSFDLYCNLIKETIISAKSSIPLLRKKTIKDEDKTKTIQELDREKLEKFSKDDKGKLN